jgi:hypothetical protein
MTCLSRIGGAFIDEVEAIVARIEESPAQFPVWPGNPRFQKAVLPEILAVAHGARKSGYWARRK